MLYINEKTYLSEEVCFFDSVHKYYNLKLKMQSKINKATSNFISPIYIDIKRDTELTKS